MTQEELKTCLGQLLSDLRGNWAFDYEERLYKAQELCNQIEDNTDDVKSKIEEQLQGDYDGRTFRGTSFYCYSSKEGITKEVKEWLKENLTFPDHCDFLD